ncbi:MAG: hypothetical protein EXS55_02730 [Candidatus Magasanikbacteria bacterium]|nr:hypothetical protein [Candidatus Magasanikbacteria bacterium]
MPTTPKFFNLLRGLWAFAPYITMVVGLGFLESIIGITTQIIILNIIMALLLGGIFYRGFSVFTFKQILIKLWPGVITMIVLPMIGAFFWLNDSGEIPPILVPVIIIVCVSLPQIIFTTLFLAIRRWWKAPPRPWLPYLVSVAGYGVLAALLGTWLAEKF